MRKHVFLFNPLTKAFHAHNHYEFTDLHIKYKVSSWKIRVKSVLTWLALGLFLLTVYIGREFVRFTASGEKQLKNLQRSFGLTDIEPLFISDVPYFMNKSVAIVGMIKDAEQTIGNLMKQLDQMSCMFGVSAIMIFESNSKDKTPQILQKWQQTPINCSSFKFNPVFIVFLYFTFL